mmetsp:Transcript_440/g.1164  ORF Transcript_440/g.1164 Transcript_440/m.1164 type:complete len:620 (+) Transcript_440:132-1991(+)
MTYYNSTRGGVKGAKFLDTVEAGYTVDNGLYIPEKIPKFSVEDVGEVLEREREARAKLKEEKAPEPQVKETNPAEEAEGVEQEGSDAEDGSEKSCGNATGAADKDDNIYSYRNLALYIFSLFIYDTEIPLADLSKLVEDAFGAGNFCHKDIVGIVNHSDVDNDAEDGGAVGDLHLGELFHGQTLAFKDLGLSFLAETLAYSIRRRNRIANILVATSGDTGGSAVHAVKNKANMNLFVLYPAGGRITDLQERQMTTVLSHNVRAVAVEGTSDDADVPIRELFKDVKFAKSHRLCSINSINWCRILVQVVHYVYVYMALRSGHGPIDASDELTIAIPSGALGNLTAGLIARGMGLPLRFICGCNANGMAAHFLQTGEFVIPKKVRATTSPAMDISMPYNVERILYLLTDGDTKVVAELMEDVEKVGHFKLEKPLLEKLREGVVFTTSVNDEDTLETIRRYHARSGGYTLCPHSAIGVRAVQLYRQATGRSERVCALLTAHPGKFSSTVSTALGQDYRYAPLEALRGLPTSSITFPENKERWTECLRDLVAETSKRWRKRKPRAPRAPAPTAEPKSVEEEYFDNIPLGGMLCGVVILLVCNLFLVLGFGLPRVWADMMGIDF